MKRNWKDLLERALTSFVITFAGVWIAMGADDFTMVNLKAALVGTGLSLIKNIALQGSVTQTPREAVPVEERVS